MHQPHARASAISITIDNSQAKTLQTEFESVYESGSGVLFLFEGPCKNKSWKTVAQTDPLETPLPENPPEKQLNWI